MSSTSFKRTILRCISNIKGRQFIVVSYLKWFFEQFRHPVQDRNRSERYLSALLGRPVGCLDAPSCLRKMWVKLGPLSGPLSFYRLVHYILCVGALGPGWRTILLHTFTMHQAPNGEKNLYPAYVINYRVDKQNTNESKAHYGFHAGTIYRPLSLARN